MDKNRTAILQANDERWFDFDYNYWSFDGFEQQQNGYLAPSGGNSQYADQKRIFNDIGTRLIQQAFKGYHSTLFAYGQTGMLKKY